jgi:hypothetical protein
MYLRNLIEIRMVHPRRRSTTAAASAPAPVPAPAAPPAAATTTVTMTGAGAPTALRTAGKSGWRTRRRAPSARWRAHAAPHPGSELAFLIFLFVAFLIVDLCSAVGCSGECLVNPSLACLPLASVLYKAENARGLRSCYIISSCYCRVLGQRAWIKGM